MQRIKELDSIRGLAALVIVFYHLFWVHIGLLGSAIDLFFVLSGYLITSIILAHAPSRGFLFAFYARRGLRIWPIYYLALLLLVAVNRWTANPGSLEGLPYYLTFTQLTPTYWSDTAPAFIPAFRHTWSLAVEEQFYLIWPAVLLLMRRRGVAASALVVVAFALAMRLAGVNRWVLATNADGLALGALLAALLRDREGSSDREALGAWFRSVGIVAAASWIALSAIIRLAPGGIRPGIEPACLAIQALSLRGVYFSLVGLIVVHAGHARLGLLRDRRLVYLGQISYGLYLYHHIIFHFWDDYAERHGLESHLVYDLARLGLSLGVAALSFRYIERPLQSIKDRFPYPAEEAGEARPRSEWVVVPVPGTEMG